MVFEESVLAQQFDNTKWTEQGTASYRVKEWTPNDVLFWAQNLVGISDDLASIFVENQITGPELLAMNMEGLKMLGLTRPGTSCVLLKGIEELDKASRDATTLVEHSPYCFGRC